ncbi:aldehyde-activating protein [Pseudomonas sp. CCM 7891]|uniref:Aldehyde-activating protein n=1 Tax=Pseudomonas karstica TaxID=1055468 RepID=A0A7X2RVV3_9PSED|nr:GFA family protein [Pseudomonas karstica]MTD21961.1 aldehyde-activating protein [Pseudomonas karstica]
MHNPVKLLHGSCFCKTVHYQADSLDMPISHCHCHSCRKVHAAAFVTTAGVMREHFRWSQGVEFLSSFESSPGKLRHFCSRCGSHLMAEREHQPHVIVRVATLDDDPGTQPTCHIWTSHDVPWLSHEGLEQCEQWKA